MNTKQANVLGRAPLSAEIRTLGQELLDHQCWVFGRDVLNPGNNLLIKKGFHQVRCLACGLTQYELPHALGENSHIFLWGFGAFFGTEAEGIFLSRSGFAPLRTKGRVELHSKDNLPFFHESSNIELLLKGIAWFAHYEDWISLHMSEEYGLQTLAEFPRRTLHRWDLAVRWRQLAYSITEDQDCLQSALISSKSSAN
jgi:hypothetical protein